MAMVTADASAAADAATKQPDTDKDYSSYNGASTAGAGGGSRRGGGGGGGVVESVVARWRREDMLDKCPLALHAAAAAFAFVALVLVASNQHGDWMQFDRYQEYMCADLSLAAKGWSSIRASSASYMCCVVARYLLAIAALAFAYSLAQALRHAYRMRGGADPIPAPSARLFDFIADQVVAYLLMSALSAAIPITNRMRTAVINNFTDATAAAISMAFLAFVALALSAMVSGYKLSRQMYM